MKRGDYWSNKEFLAILRRSPARDSVQMLDEEKYIWISPHLSYSEDDIYQITEEIFEQTIIDFYKCFELLLNSTEEEIKSYRILAKLRK
jgi:hypothetical protein